jgi:hypothetical protein
MSSGHSGADMSVKSKVMGLLRSVFGIYRIGSQIILGSNASLRLQLEDNTFRLATGSGSVWLFTTTGGNGSIGPHVIGIGADAITEGSATTATSRIAKKTGIADNTATAVFTVTVPNGNHAAAIRVHAIGSSGGADAFESTATLEGNIVVARTTGANAVVTAAAAALTGTATVAAGAALTSFAYGVSAVAGAAGATNTFDITVTINDSGNLGSNQCVMICELINAESSGVSMAAA